ncbi:MAG: SDR family NAD(P)-dependent oxidoreductase [Acidimicrobiales bacterium]
MRDAIGGVQSVLVLGGGSDLATATVRRLVAERCRTVVLAARQPEMLESEMAALRSAGATSVEAVTFDADDVTSHEKVIDDVFARHGDIDMVLLAFGVLGDQDFFDHDPEAAPPWPPPTS